ncbi:uncharacterized protein B0H18DRAFT_955946 [Fomitopsis serialis]|uniref:uncharacterized protein n=1 Tax=Fomitopsis serialis TaxID=139415 RepID=UPI00200815FD|nr:uncharacterized protein B0H18DRAFT_955946 [Neoantrodia serialis]KAH9923256.1 hypothetical protein B0H18DRAFT_955946 [Neoantrodia serialis]
MPACDILTRRSDGDSSLGSDVVPIIGIAIAAAIAGIAAIAVGVYFWRKRRAAKRERDAWQSRISVFPTVRIETTPSRAADGSVAQMTQAKGNGFSRAQLTKSVIMPERAVLKNNASKEEIVDYYAAEGKLPRPFAPFTRDGSLSSGPPSPKESSRSSRSSMLRPTSTASFLSVASAYSSRSSAKRQSTASAMSSFDEGNKRKVRQLFHPTLPDELVLNLGERVTIVNTFDDGWCIVGRDSVFAPGDVDLGAVPAWVFVKPIKGLRAERPIRTTSLGVTVTLDMPGAARQDVVSWSNFS